MRYLYLYGHFLGGYTNHLILLAKFDLLSGLLKLQFGGNIDDLSLLLDPDGKDVEIDIHDFHTGLKEWIQDIRKQR